MAGKKSNASARFPVARIKKIIQADEDVGKVAQGTPVVVSKALELFLASLVQECVKDAEERGSKKLTAYGFKRTINKVQMFDFCTDIVANIPDPITPEEDEKPKRKPRATKPKGDGPPKKRAKKVKEEPQDAAAEAEPQEEADPEPKKEEAADDDDDEQYD